MIGFAAVTVYAFGHVHHGNGLAVPPTVASHPDRQSRWIACAPCSATQSLERSSIGDRWPGPAIGRRGRASHEKC